MKEKPSESRFALCIENSEYEDLEKRKIYQILPDAEAAKRGNLSLKTKKDRKLSEVQYGNLFRPA